ncbi:hypothetical protein, partial [Actinomyces qiguomingii]
MLGAALLSALLMLAGIGSLGGRELPASGNMLPVLMGFGLSGRINVSATSMLGVSADGAFTLLPLGTIVAVAVGVFVLARRRATSDFSQGPLGVVALRAVVEATAVAIVSCLFCGLPTYNPGGRGEMTVTASAGWIAMTVWVIVFGALFMARAGLLLMVRVPVGARQVLREFGALTLVSGIVLGTVGVVGAAFAALANDVSGVIPLIPVLAGNLLLYALTLGTFGAIAGDAGRGIGLGAQDIPLRETFFAWDLLGFWSVLLFAAVALLAIVAAARIGVRRPRLAAANMGRAWPLPSMAFVIGLIVLHVLAPARASVDFLGPQTSGHVSPAWWSSLTLTVFVLAVSVLAEVVPTWLYANANSFLRLCAGSRAVDEWITGLPHYDATAAQMPAPAAPTPASSSAPVGYDGAPDAAAPTSVISQDPVAAPAPTAAPTQAGPAPAPTSNFAPSAPTVPAPPVTVPTSAASAGAAAPPLPEPKPMSQASRRRVKLVVGVLLACLVVVGIGAVAVHVLNSRRGPEQVVESYLSLIADGRASEANAMVDPGVPNAQRLLLTDEVLGAATSRIEVVEVTQDAQNTSPNGADIVSGREGMDGGERLTVTATLSLDGQRFPISVPVKAGGKEFGLLNTWELDVPLVREVTLRSDSLDAITVGGTEVPLEDSEYGGASTTQYVYFGIYELGVGAGVSDYLEPDQNSLTVDASFTGGVEVNGEPTQTLEDLVLEAVNAQATQCVTPPGNMDDVCPYPLRSTKLDSLKVTAPATEVRVRGDSFESGAITFTFRENPSNWNKNPEDRTNDYAFSGKIEWPEGGGEPTITV